jgi:hypothetical protein
MDVVRWSWKVTLVLALGAIGCTNNPTALVVTPLAPSIAKGTSLQLAASSVQGGKVTNATSLVSWTTADATVASVSSSGLVTALKAGSTTMTGKLGSLTGTATLTVTSATLQSIQVTGPKVGIAMGTQEQLTATGVFSDGTHQDLTQSAAWTASGGAQVSSGGLVTAATVGDSTVVARAQGVSGSFGVSVTDAKLVSLGVTPPSPTLAQGLTQQLTAIGRFSDNSTQDLSTQVSWSSSSPTQVSISSSGLASALAATSGSISITATYGGVSGNASVTVSPAALVSIGISTTQTTVPAGLQQQFNAMGTYTDHSAQPLTSIVSWTSSNTSVATISNSSGTQGTLTTLAAGTTTITATDPVTSKNATLLFTVSAAAVNGLTVSPSSPSIPQGTTQQFVAMASYTDGSSQNVTSAATWTSSDTTQATISNAAGNPGIATGVLAGGRGVTITAAYGGFSNTASLAITAPTLVSITVSPANLSLPLGETQQFTATGNFSDGSQADLTNDINGEWYDDTLGLQMYYNSISGLAQAIIPGQDTVYFWEFAGPYAGMTGQVVVNVTNASLTALSVTPGSASVPANASVQFTATGTYSDNSTLDLTSAVTWISSDTTQAVISNSAGSQGVALGVAAGGGVTVTASYQGFSAQASLAVKTVSSIAIVQNPLNVASGGTGQLNAIATYTDSTTSDITASAFWSTTDSTIAIVANGAAGGTVTGTYSGAIDSQSSTTITASFGGFNANTTVVIRQCPDATFYTVGGLCTKDYWIPQSQLTSQPSSCGGYAGDQYGYTNGSPLTFGFTWTDSPGALTTVTNVVITVNHGIDCAYSGSDNVDLNGTVLGTYPHNNNCYCASPFNEHLVFSDSGGAGYLLNSTNAFNFDDTVVDNYEGMSPDSALNGYYAKVSVTYQ